ncbi:unnamed protein product [Caenorhabditis auriculariae]|uniref:C3H1-type domain-containing protein n=1 Tax=Caenorhabditis auriculariae TaxID=2777116 RepID=A0A8S1GN14_9PELO|nr:unnamed protein product [Caenorhabditis auriculariae]
MSVRTGLPADRRPKEMMPCGAISGNLMFNILMPQNPDYPSDLQRRKKITNLWSTIPSTTCAVRPMERKHAPLCRVSPRPPARVDPQLHFENDSCYSSSSEESHPALSRESSDALSTDSSLVLTRYDTADFLTLQPPPEALEFASNCGYSRQQLMHVLNRIGFDAGQDRILSELVQLGPGAMAESSKLRESFAPSDFASSLRSIVIDGSNIAMTHGLKKVFSCAGIRECVRYFTERGHKDVIVIIPQFRKEAPRSDCPITDQHILFELEKQGYIVWTPSRTINGRRIVCHDDRYILKTAEEKDAVIVSNDEYRDLVRENPQYRRLVDSRLLMYTLIDGRFMPPDDPLGRHGPKLDFFLSKTQNFVGAQPCPYARKCTYGNKCKYYHPERVNGGHMSVTERLLKENNHKKAAQRASMQYGGAMQNHAALARTRSLNAQLEALSMQDTKNFPSRRHVELTMSAPWHAAVGRNNSMPLSSSNYAPPQSATSQTHLFAPSTAVWGHSELSVGPLSTTRPVDEDENASRARLQYHLCHVFPESVVVAVMAAHPEEKSSQVLCERILALQKGFQN